MSEPFEGPPPDAPSDPASAGSTPLEPGELEAGPAEEPARGPDLKTAHMVRMILMFGPMWRIRIREVDPVLALGVEAGRMHGFSGAFHATFVPPERRRPEGVPGVTEASLGLGAVARGRLTRPLYGSIGLTAGIRIHRARTDIGVLHRVDPDFRLPIQGAWTIKGIGLSLALVPGYAVRARAYESRGQVVWRRSAVRVELLFGLHWDVMVHGGAAEGRGRTGRRRR